MLKDHFQMLQILFHDVLYTSMLSRYAKQKSYPDSTCDMRLQNTPGSEHIPKGIMFQYQLPHVVAKTVFGIASSVRLKWW